MDVTVKDTKKGDKMKKVSGVFEIIRDVWLLVMLGLGGIAGILFALFVIKLLWGGLF